MSQIKTFEGDRQSLTRGMGQESLRGHTGLVHSGMGLDWIGLGVDWVDWD